jgi:heme-degrading monooxygenase HmoA
MHKNEIAKTPSAPYYAVIFTSVRTEDDNGYSHMSDKMVELVKDQPGYLGHESARNEIGITVSYWSSIEAIKNWKNNSSHVFAQNKGKSTWYGKYKARICKVESDYDFDKI